MWFRNLRIYRLQDPFDLGADGLEALLGNHRARTCGPLESATVGWVSPLGPSGTTLVHAADRRLLVCAERNERLLPASVVRQEVARQAAEVEQAEERKLRRRERLELRDRVVQALLPRAFVRATRVLAYVDPALGLLLVDTASAKRADELVDLLRESLGSLRLRPLSTERPPPLTLAGWLAGATPADIDLDDLSVLREPVEGGGVLRSSGLAPEAVRTHLEAGLVPRQLAVRWGERIGVVVGEDLVLRRLRFLDLVQQEAAAVETEDPLVRFDADFAIMAHELADFVPRLLDLLGGPSQGAE